MMAPRGPHPPIEQLSDEELEAELRQATLRNRRHAHLGDLLRERRRRLYGRR